MGLTVPLTAAGFTPPTVVVVHVAVYWVIAVVPVYTGATKLTVP